MEIIETAKAIIWVCLAICAVIFATLVIISFIRTNKQEAEKDKIKKQLVDNVANDIGQIYGNFFKEQLEKDAKKEKGDKK